MPSRERVSAESRILVPLNEADVVAAADALVADECAAIAIVFLFSFLEPAHERRAPKGQALINQGDAGDFLIILLEGQVRITVYSANGREMGSMSVRLPSSRSASRDMSASPGRRGSPSAHMSTLRKSWIWTVLTGTSFVSRPAFRSSVYRKAS